MTRPVPPPHLLPTLDEHDNLLWLRNSLPFKWLNRVGLVSYYVGATLGAGELRSVLGAVGFDVAGYGDYALPAGAGRRFGL